MFDVTKLDTQTLSEQGVDMSLRNPSTGAVILDSTGKPVTVKLLGRNSEAFRGVQRALQAEAAARQARDIPQTEAEKRAEMQRVATACTVGWSDMEFGGEPFPFSPANAAKLWADTRWTWALTQAFVFINQEGNFLANSAAG